MTSMRRRMPGMLPQFTRPLVGGFAFGALYLASVTPLLWGLFGDDAAAPPRLLDVYLLGTTIIAFAFSWIPAAVHLAASVPLAGLILGPSGQFDLLGDPYDLWRIVSYVLISAIVIAVLDRLRRTERALAREHESVEAALSTSRAELSRFQAAMRERDHLLEGQRQTRELLGAIVDNAPVGIALLRGHDELRYVLANPAFQALTPNPERSVIGHTVEEIWGTGAAPNQETALRTGQRVDVVQQPLLASPGRFWSGHIVPLAGDGERQLLVIGSDVTEQVEAQRRLEELVAAEQAHTADLTELLVRLRTVEDRQRLALDAAEMGTWFWDLERNELVWDERCRALFGMGPGEAPTFDAFLGRVHPDDRAATRKRVEMAIEHGVEFEAEYRVPVPGQGTRWLHARGRAERGRRGEISRMSGVVLDVTARRRAEERLRQAQKLESIGLLAGGVAHDFNNLLVGVMGNASLVLDRLSEADPVRPLVEDILHASEASAELVGKLLAYSGRSFAVREEIDLADLVIGMQPALRDTLSPNVELRLEIGGGPTRASANRGQAEQILVNLVSNAGEAIPVDRGGTVEVRVGGRRTERPEPVHGGDLAPGEYVELVVRDDGTGMDAATLARVFDPFFTTKFAGRGLGLAAVAGIVRALGGGIQAESAPGAGTTFRVYLPALGTVTRG